jgi:hypothetical protein
MRSAILDDEAADSGKRSVSAELAEAAELAATTYRFTIKATDKTWRMQ